MQTAESARYTRRDFVKLAGVCAPAGSAAAQTPAGPAPTAGAHSTLWWTYANPGQQGQVQPRDRDC
jgi:hypothetical protein